MISASAKAQLAPFVDPSCHDPTHSMLSKDHFTNILNPVAGRVATTVLQYVVPRILFAWSNPGVPVDEVSFPTWEWITYLVRTRPNELLTGDLIGGQRRLESISVSTSNYAAVAA